MRIVLFLVCAVWTPVLASDLDLTQFSLEELMNIEVELVSRRPQRLVEVPAAVHALTAEDLRRAGVRSIPDALRLVPGFQVAGNDANKWGITARGFNNIFADRLLVLIDGRSVYSPTFSGVFWQVHDAVLEDVERIEVIRGPGGTLWGANAINGIVNIVTKDARHTQGGLVQTGGGSQERWWGAARYGGRLGEGAFYRVYAKHLTRTSWEDESGRDLEDDWRLSRLGGRADWRLSQGDRLMLQADAYDLEFGQTSIFTTSLEPPYTTVSNDRAPLRGYHVLGRWERRLEAGSDLSLQVYYDLLDGDLVVLDGQIETVDFDFQMRHRYARHELVWGLGYRLNGDAIDGSFATFFEPARRTVHLASAFAHDEMDLVPGRLRLSLGSKFERNTYTGFEMQPGLRLWWTPGPYQALWAGVTRAVHVPSRADNNMHISAQVLPPGELFPEAPLTLVRVVGNEDVEAESILSLESGYRLLPDARLSLDLATHYNFYDNMITSEQGLPAPQEGPPAHVIFPLLGANRAEGRTWGLEVAVDWQARQNWQLRGGYTFIGVDISLDENSTDFIALEKEEESPRHQFVLRSLANLSDRLELDATARYVDDLAAQSIPAYLTADVRLGWRPSERLEVSLVGRNLLDSPHAEFAPLLPINLPGVVRASFHVALTWSI